MWSAATCSKLKWNQPINWPSKPLLSSCQCCIVDSTYNMFFFCFFFFYIRLFIFEASLFCNINIYIYFFNLYNSGYKCRKYIILILTNFYLTKILELVFSERWNLFFLLVKYDKSLIPLTCPAPPVCVCSFPQVFDASLHPRAVCECSSGDGMDH